MDRFTELLRGKETNDYVLFIDIQGTSSTLKAIDRATNPWDAVLFTQHRMMFITTLSGIASSYSSIRVFQHSDCAFCYSCDLHLLLKFSLDLFKRHWGSSGQLMKWPMRGGIGKGVSYLVDEVQDLRPPNYKYFAGIGIGNVEAAELEKNADPKNGMRLFISERVKADMFPEWNIRTRRCSILDGAFEVKWTCPSPDDPHGWEFARSIGNPKTWPRTRDFNKYQHAVVDSIQDMFDDSLWE